MHSLRKRLWWPFAGVVASIAVFSLLQQRATSRLENEAKGLREQRSAWTRIRTEHARLRAEQVSPGALAGLRDDHEAVGRLRREIEEMKQRTSRPKASPHACTPLGTNFFPESRVAESRNVGQGTPVDALQTALWAAAQGNVETLAGIVHLEGAARVRAAAQLEALSPEVRARYPTPERWIATLTAKDIPLDGLLRYHTIASSQGDKSQLMITLTAKPVGPMRVLGLQRVDGVWKLVVPESAVAAYGLQGESTK